ncbi:MAG: HlyD family efflux transporter periplasmic adaptor subunit [Planctomycetales bacterium]|nr:HlyD family efflux transporter periplasmic adaptor subunit [Planctomycetales bacterium]
MVGRQELASEFPALQLVRTSRFVRSIGKLTFLLLLLSIVAMIFVPWRQTARGIGTVLALDPQQRPQQVTSGSKGVVRWVKPGLREGSLVEKDELLLQLAPFAADGVSQLDAQLSSIEAKRSAAESSRTVAEQAELLQKSSGESLIKSLEQDYLAAHQKWEQTKNEVLALQAELDDKRNQLRVAEQVASQGLVSREELFSKQQAVEAQRNKVLKSESAVEEAYASLMSKEGEIESKKQEIYIKNRAAQQKVLEEIQKIRSIEKELTDLETKRAEFDRLEVRAPRSGVIQQWNGLEGSDTIKEGDQLFVIVPATEQLAVELRISGNDMPLVQEGDPVRLQFEGWPAVQFVGWPSVAVGTFGGKVNRVFPTDDGNGFFRIVVTPDNHFSKENGWPDSRYLRQGVRANGWVLLKQVPLGYEIWRQLNGFPPTISIEEPKQNKSSKVKLPKL